MRLIAPDELAIHILDRQLRVQLIDVRDPQQFGKWSLPGAMNLPAGSLFGKEARTTLLGPHTLKVFLGGDERSGADAASLATLNGVENVSALQGGLDAFLASIVNGTRDPGLDAETAAFRARAGVQIAALIQQQSAPRPAKAVRRVQSGCGG